MRSQGSKSLVPERALSPKSGFTLVCLTIVTRYSSSHRASHRKKKQIVKLSEKAEDLKLESK